jgi:threonine dehydratase
MASTSIDPELARKIDDANKRLKEQKKELHIPTPLFDAHRLSNEVSHLYGRPINVWVKMENLQRTGSFKIRGAYHKLKTLRDDGWPDGSEVVAASAGNHAQGVALAAKLIGFESRIFVPSGAPSFKLRAIANYGAQLKQEESLETAVDEAKKYATNDLGAEDLFIHPYDDWDIIAGQGTIGLEIYQQLSRHIENLKEQDLTVVVPVGGGGLAAGIAYALKEHQECENWRIIGVQSEKAPAAKLSLEEQTKVTQTPSYTIADGIKVEAPGDKPLAVLLQHMHSMYLADDGAISHAVYKLLYMQKTVAEPAGAAALAAILNNSTFDRPEIHGSDVVVVVSGGNTDISRLAWGAMQEHAREGFVFRVEGKVRDEPGTLAKVAGVCQRNSGNILLTRQERIRPDTPPGYALITMYIEILGPLDTQKPQKDVQNKIEKIIQQLKHDEDLKDSAKEPLCLDFKYDWALRKDVEGA